MREMTTAETDGSVMSRGTGRDRLNEQTDAKRFRLRMMGMDEGGKKNGMVGG